MGDDKFLANFRVFFTFHGISSHAAGAPELGRSALDAVEIMDIGVNYMREHMIDAARVHGAITNTGGIAPNVIPAEAQILYAIRAPKVTQVKKLYERMCDIAKGAALITGTTVDIQSGCGLFQRDRIMTLWRRSWPGEPGPCYSGRLHGGGAGVRGKKFQERRHGA